MSIRIAQKFGIKKHAEVFILPGTILVALLLFGTRWLSHVGVPPIYISDFLLLLTLVFWAVATLVGRGSRLRFETISGALGFSESSTRNQNIYKALWALAGLAVFLRFLFSDLSINALRDVAPFVYLLLLAALGYIGAKRPQRAQSRTFSIFLWALTAHSVWVLLSMVLYEGYPPVIANSITTFFGYSVWEQIPYFSVRGDLDFALVALTAMLWTIRAFEAEGSIFNNSFLRAYIFSAFSIGVFGAFQVARASLVAAFLLALVGLVFVSLLTRRTGSLRVHASKAVLFLVTISGVGFAVDAPANLALTVERVVSAVAVLDSPTSASIQQVTPVPISQGEGFGSAAARLNTWSGLAQWYFENPTVQHRGIGFGEDFMEISDTKGLFLGEHHRGTPKWDALRAPHNFAVTVLARLGIWAGAVFLVFVAFPLLISLRAIFAPHEAVHGETWRMQFAYLTLIAMGVVALFGVVLESPFGAIPYGWFSGYLVGSLPQRRLGSTPK